jgi:hypothetical protein
MSPSRSIGHQVIPLRHDDPRNCRNQAIARFDHGSRRALVNECNGDFSTVGAGYYFESVGFGSLNPVTKSHNYEGPPNQ